MIKQTETNYPDTPAGERMKFIRLIKDQSQNYGQVVTQAAEKVTQQKDYPENNSLAAQLKIVSRLIAGGLKTPLYLVRLDGFDTHDGQVDPNDHTKGWHAYLLKQLSEAIYSFMRDLEFQGVADRVMGMTLSEFGRRIVSNASGGTDHGTAAPLFLFGNAVKAGVTGRVPVVPAGAKYNDNLKMQYDFRQIYSSVFEQWFCVKPDILNQIFLGDFQTMPLLKYGLGCFTSTLQDEKGSPFMKIFPNPAQGVVRLGFLSDGNPVRISIYGMDGKMLRTIVNNTYPEGEQRMQFDISDMPAAHYFCIYQSGDKRQSLPLIKSKERFAATRQNVVPKSTKKSYENNKGKERRSIF